MDDTVEITGLSELLDDDEELPYLDIGIRCAGRVFRAAVLTAEGEWTVNVRDERGRSCPGSGDLYATQSEAIIAGALIALDLARQRIP
jgi:hypothetical protein